MRTAYLCAACGVQFAESPSPPPRCPICEDSRVFGMTLGARQRWTSLPELRARHRNRLRELEPGLVSIRIEPQFSVGHHAVLVQGPGGNILWDCISLIDDATIEAVHELGGVAAIAISHPHFHGSMVEWSRAFGNVPIYIHEADRTWVMRSDPAITFWQGASLRLDDEFTLVHCGGHFDGGTVLHAAGRGDRPARLLTGDVIAVRDAENVTFMHNYPKRIPLRASAIRHIVEAIEPFEFERIHGCWPQDLVPARGKQVVLRSAQRYIDETAI